jgi:hypothetical protein
MRLAGGTRSLSYTRGIGFQKFCGAILFALLACGPLLAQETHPAWRAVEWQAARREKAALLEHEKLSSADVRLNAIRDGRVIERFTQGLSGFRLVLGGMPTGQGFAIGPEYLRRDLAHGQLEFRTSARGALSKAVLLDLQVSLPRLAHNKAFVDFYAAHQNSPRIDYYGPGPDSRKDDRTNFRLETNSYDFTAGVKPISQLRLGVTGGFLQANTGPGNHEEFPTTEDLFVPAMASGLFDQPDFWRGGFMAHFDYRDNPGGARSGGSYIARFLAYDDRNLGLHDFRRLELDAQQYIPFFNKRRVIALRVNSRMSYANNGQSVPFYLQPTIGGSDDLRGFRSYRFYADNAIVANAEYRWETFSGLDAALFFDAGKVAEKRSQVNFHNLEAAAGFGLRFNVRNNTFMRIDVGFSHEGTQIWLKFANPF